MYKEKELQKIVNKAKSKTDVLNALGKKNNGGNFNILSYYLKLYNINIEHFSGRNGSAGCKKEKRNLKDILVENSDYLSSTHLKDRLYKEGLKERKCELCGQDENWMDKKMSLILDHKNGRKFDNRLENLRIVCPNCNATLETHCRGDRYLKKEKVKNIKIRETREEKEKRLIKSRKVERPSLIQILKDVDEFGFSGTGRKYKVSDNCIRKWIKYYNK